MSRLFAALHYFVWHRPRATMLMVSVLCAASVFAMLRLRFSSDIAKILPKESPAVDAVGEVLDNFAFTGQMFLFFEKTDAGASDAAVMKFSDAIGNRLRTYPEVIAAEWRIEPESEKFMFEMVSNNGALLLPDEAMDGFLERLQKKSIRDAVRKTRRRLSQPGVGVSDFLLDRDPMNLTMDFFAKSLAAGRPAGNVDFTTGYYFSKDGTALAMTVDGARPPHDVAFARKLVDRVNGAILEARAEVPAAAGWRVSLLGGYPIAVQSEKTIKSDLVVNLFTSIPPVLFMLVISLRRWSSLAIGASALTVGILWTFGVAGVVYGHLTAVTAGFAGLLAGMGIDFTIHMFHRYSSERAAGASPAEASLTTYTGSGPGAFIAMITTAFSIMCLWVSRFQGLREFATLVGVGVLLVFIASFTVIPLFTRRERGVAGGGEVPRFVVGICWGLFVLYFAFSVSVFTVLGVFIAVSCVAMMTKTGTRFCVWLIVDRAPFTALLCIGLTLLGGYGMSLAPFGLPERESDVKNLRTEGDDTLDIQKRMQDAYGAGNDPILVLVKAKTEDEAMDQTAAVFRALATLPDASQQAVIQFVPPASDQKRRVERLRSLNADEVIADLDDALDAEGFDVTKFDGARAWLRGLITARTPLRPSDIRDPFFLSLRNRFMSFAPDGTVRSLVWFTPRSPLHLRSERERLINTLDATARAAAPEARISGFSVIVKEIDERIGPDIFWSSLAGAAVSILLAWVLYGSFKWMVVSIFPALVGTIWFLGCLKLLDIRMNYLNLITFPIMTGLATDNGLYLVERFREMRERSARETVAALWPSLTLTSLTSVVGFGSLAFSQNRAMKSLGVAMSIGMLCYLYASVLVLPPLLKWLEKPDRRKDPVVPPDVPSANPAGGS